MRLQESDEALFREWCAEWRPVGNKTAPAERSRAELAITRLYREIGEKAPRFIWCPSPIAGACAIGWKPPYLPGLEPPPRCPMEIGEPLADRLRAKLQPPQGVPLREQVGSERYDRLLSCLEIERRLLVGAGIDRAVMNRLLSLPTTELARAFIGQDFRRIAKLPSSAVLQVKDRRLIVAHSETGHHHAIDTPAVQYYREPGSPTLAYLAVDGEFADVVHHRPYDTHEALRLTRGFWEVRRQPEWSPEGWRMVRD